MSSRRPDPGAFPGELSFEGTRFFQREYRFESLWVHEKTPALWRGLGGISEIISMYLGLSYTASANIFSAFLIVVGVSFPFVRLALSTTSLSSLSARSAAASDFRGPPNFLSGKYRTNVVPALLTQSRQPSNAAIS